MKISATVMPSQVYDDLDAQRLEVPAQPAVRGVERGERDAGHGRRQSEGQVYHASTSRRPGKR